MEKIYRGGFYQMQSFSEEGYKLKGLKVFFKYVALLENVLCTLGLFLTTFLAFFQVLNRYWFRFEILWLNDVAIFSFIFFMFMAIPLTTRENDHTGVDVFLKKFFSVNSLGARKFNLFLKVLIILTIAVFMRPTWDFAVRSLKYPQYATLVRWFNMSWLMEALFVCIFLCFLHVLYDGVCELVAIRAFHKTEDGR